MVKVPFTLEKSQESSLIITLILNQQAMENLNHHKLNQLHRVVLIYHMMTLNGSTIITHYPMMIQMKDILFHLFILRRWKISKWTSKHNQLFYQFFLSLWIQLVRHCMEIIKQLTKHLNQSQKQIIITGDQPVYTLGKKVQWMFPDQFRDVMWMIDPLHIEMVFLDAIGNWLDGSGWTSIFERAKITTTGQIESYLSGNKVKQTRYTHQVSMALLIHLSFLSFQK